MSITDLLDRPIAYHRVFVTLTGSVKAAILLSQAMYWQKRAKQADGWWYKTADEWQDETGLTRREQERARKDAIQFLKTKRKDVPAKLYWNVDEAALEAALISLLGESRVTEKGSLDAIKSETIKDTETTTENITRGKTPTHKPPAIKKPATTKGQESYYHLALALSRVTGMSFEANKPRLFKTAKQLSKDERVTPEKIDQDYDKGGAWYQHDWRGRKGERPNLANIVETICSWDDMQAAKNTINVNMKER